MTVNQYTIGINKMGLIHHVLGMLLLLALLFNGINSSVAFAQDDLSLDSPFTDDLFGNITEDDATAAPEMEQDVGISPEEDDGESGFADDLFGDITDEEEEENEEGEEESDDSEKPLEDGSDGDSSEEAGDPDDTSDDNSELDDSDRAIVELHEQVEFAHFPRERAPIGWELFESIPKALSCPIEPIAKTFGCLIGAEHDHITSALDEHAIGLHHIPDRPPLLIEWNETFLGKGWMEQGIETKTGAIWRPAFWVFGEFRTALQNANRDGVAVAEQANRLDLFGQVNLSGTERILLGVRPLDEEDGGSRDFTGYDYIEGNSRDGWNADVHTLFFEGDLGEVFPGLDPHDTKWLDYGFSVGRMPLLAQQGLLINEDRIDALTVTRNTVNGNGNLNLRTTGIYSWGSLNRNSPTGDPLQRDGSSRMIAILSESDFARATVNVDGLYLFGDDSFGDLFAFGMSAIQRHHGYENTYNTSLHLLASFPEGGETDFAGQGELLFAQTSWTPHHTEDLVYVNSFWAIDQFTRGPHEGTGLGQTGLLFSGPGLGRFGSPISVRTDSVVGASLGYQMFFEHTRQQLICEFGGFTDTNGDDRGAIGATARYQKAVGHHSILLIDGFVSNHEAENTSRGLRMEWRVKF